jgi:hypothetical protein
MHWFGPAATRWPSFGLAFTSLLCGLWGPDHPQPNNGPVTELGLHSHIPNSKYDPKSASLLRFMLRRLLKHPAQVKSRLQSDGSGGEISRFSDRAVEYVNCDSPVMPLALIWRQFTKNSHRIPNGRQNTVFTNQFECQWRGANQSCSLSGSGIARAALPESCGHLVKCPKSRYKP